MSLLDVVPSGGPPAADAGTAAPALLRRRALAAAFDLGVCYLGVESVPIAVLVWAVPAAVPPTATTVAWSLLALAPVYLTYCFGFEWRQGRTPGKAWQGLVVARPDGTPAGPSACAVRNLLRYVDWLPACYLLGWALARSSPAGQRLGDRLADTVVARVAVPGRADRADAARAAARERGRT